MVRPRYLLIGVGVALVYLSTLSAPALAAGGGDCTFVSKISGTCAQVSSDGRAIDVRGAESTVEESKAGRADSAGPKSTARPLTPAELQALFDEACYGDGQCGTRTTGMLNPVIPTEEGDDAPAAPGEPAAVVTIADVARLLPARGVLHAEPDGWAVVGVPANLWVEVAPMTAVGELLGETAEVRFTPRFYRFDYGDGGGRSTATPGSSWAALGQEELTATPTGHVYRERGALHASVAVVYAAEYRVGGGALIAVNGAVTAEAPAVDVLVVAERTVLTAGNAAR